MLKGFCDLGEARTLDPLIKSQLLYQLSYQVVFFLLGLQRNGFFFDFGFRMFDFGII
jgi:hypothetical protein